MQGPDALDKVPYMPSDKVIHLHQANPDKRHKFSRTLEEEEEETRKRRKKHPQDEVDLKIESETAGEPSEPNDGQKPGSENDAPEEGGDPDRNKHIDVKA